LKCIEDTINWNANYTIDWSAKSATNGVVYGGVLINMLPKDHICVIQCLQYVEVMYKLNDINILLIHIFMLLNICVVQAINVV